MFDELAPTRVTETRETVHYWLYRSPTESDLKYLCFSTRPSKMGSGSLDLKFLYRNWHHAFSIRSMLDFETVDFWIYILYIGKDIRIHMNPRLWVKLVPLWIKEGIVLNYLADFRLIVANNCYLAFYFTFLSLSECHNFEIAFLLLVSLN